jgi:hypothetical protein
MSVDDLAKHHDPKVASLLYIDVAMHKSSLIYVVILLPLMNCYAYLISILPIATSTAIGVILISDPLL